MHIYIQYILWGRGAGGTLPVFLITYSVFLVFPLIKAPLAYLVLKFCGAVPFWKWYL